MLISRVPALTVTSEVFAVLKVASAGWLRTTLPGPALVTSAAPKREPRVRVEAASSTVQV